MKTSKMNSDAYAGFLKLWITPAHEMPSRSKEIDAYLRHLSTEEPLDLAAVLDELELEAELARESKTSGPVERAA
jgi:hypothetical protein